MYYIFKCMLITRVGYSNPGREKPKALTMVETVSLPSAQQSVRIKRICKDEIGVNLAWHPPPPIKNVCLVFNVLLENFLSYGEVIITGEGLQILTYNRHSWSLDRKSSLCATPNVIQGIRLYGHSRRKTVKATFESKTA